MAFLTSWQSESITKLFTYIVNEECETNSVPGTGPSVVAQF